MTTPPTGLPESPAPAPETSLRDLLVRCDSLISWSLHRHTWPADVQQDMRDTLADLRKINREPPAPSVEERAGQPSEGSTEAVEWASAPSDARGGERDLQERIAAIVLDREEGRIPTRLMTADRILDAVFADELDVEHEKARMAAEYNPRDALRGVVMAAMGKDATAPMVEAMTEQLVTVLGRPAPPEPGPEAER